MDIIDIMLAKALTPEGQADSAALAAQNSAAEAYESMEAAVSAANEALTTLQEANEAIETTNNAISGIETTITNEIDKLAFSLTSYAITNGTQYDLLIQHEDLQTKEVQGILKLYNTTGDKTDGTMTQRAITAALDEIRQQGGGGGSTNLGQNNEGKIVVIGENGNITAGTLTESEIAEAINHSGGSESLDGVVGLEIDYANKSFKRIQEAENKNAGNDFNRYAMYGGRMRCNVADDGTILAWYGDNNYKDDGSNGQVMIYQPKFYYNRIIVSDETNQYGGTIVRKEQIMISPSPKTGFKIHPIFVSPTQETLDYVLLPAYEGSAFRTSLNAYDATDSANINFIQDKLSSVGFVKPISGVNKTFTSENAERMANNRGNGWHITNFAAESLLQMLFAIEYGTLNGQSSLGLGVVNITDNILYNCSSLTGSTSQLGNTSGSAESTINEINGTQTSYNVNGKKAISYRGMENPWGNIWRIVGGINVYGNTNLRGGQVYICGDYEYTPSSINNYIDTGLLLPNSHDWISGFGYVNSNLDWAYIPVECNNGNSALPVGDDCWVVSNLNSMNKVIMGGAWYFGNSCGLFSYGMDRNYQETTRARSARLMFIPTKNEIYQSNLQKWSNKMGV